VNGDVPKDGEGGGLAFTLRPGESMDVVLPDGRRAVVLNTGAKRASLKILAPREWALRRHFVES
jgi:hypothetical protein